ncbi:MAG TPA: alpha/beta hydrolase-fold protein [Chthonomonadales bacterium]|nr:alpha/beta hydrolase-fold protein [Chthonomonadales bacterium]
MKHLLPSAALMLLGALSGATLSANGWNQSTGGPAGMWDLSRLRPWKPGAGDGNYVIGPAYSDAPELTAKPDVPKGTVHHFVMDSRDSAIYPGIAKSAPGQVVPYHRNVSVYVPAQYVSGKPAPFLVSQDSMGYGELPTILDNLIAERRLPVMVAIMIDSGGGDAQGSERGLEYDTVSGKYAEFIETEVLPRISRDYDVTFTRDPDGRMTMGGSSGGAAAFTMAWFHPELYHRVLTYSGTYVNQQSPFNPASPHGAWEYHEHFILQNRRKPLRIWMEVGEHDLRYTDPESTLHNWPMANERMAAALAKRHYHYQFVIARDAGHVDGRVFRETLPAALEWVWKGYRTKNGE